MSEFLDYGDFLALRCCLIFICGCKNTTANVDIIIGSNNNTFPIRINKKRKIQINRNDTQIHRILQVDVVINQLIRKVGSVGPVPLWMFLLITILDLLQSKCDRSAPPCQDLGRALQNLLYGIIP